MTDRVTVGLLQYLFERGKGVKFGAFIITQNDDVAMRVQIVYLQEIGVEFIISRFKNGKGQIVFYGIAVCCTVRAVDSYVEVRIRVWTEIRSLPPRELEGRLSYLAHRTATVFRYDYPR